MKTFIRRPGNKSAHLKHIIPRIPEKYNTYIEPFVGTGAVFLHLLPKKWIINDLNKDIVDIWKLARDDPQYLLCEIKKFQEKFLILSNEDKLKKCKDITSKINGRRGKKRTSMYLLMVYCCYQGCIERNDKFSFDGLYSTIYKSESVHIFTEKYVKKITELSVILKNGIVLNGDYKETLKKAKKGDFVFLDPPYIEDKNYTFNYNKDEVFDIQALLGELKKLDENGVKWMMTQADNKLTRTIFLKYRTFEYRNKKCFNGKNNGKKEVIFMNY
jgi:DNA adenine methylase